MGPFPKAMMRARYPEPTWIDVLNHFNLPQYTTVVLQEMGHLYATIPCRALYLESEQGMAEKAEACSRAWMWQELSVGPPDHAYRNAQDMWLHFVVMVGETGALRLIVDKWGKVRNTLDSMVKRHKAREQAARRRPPSGDRAPEAWQKAAMMTSSRRRWPRMRKHSPRAASVRSW